MTVTCQRCKRQFDPERFYRMCPHPAREVPPAVGPELDKALDDFVADKPKDIMRES